MVEHRNRAPANARTDLTRGPIARTLVGFALPVLGSNVLQSLNGSVNAVWVGRLLGEEALTATTNANLVLFFLLGVVFGIGMAATIFVGQAIGARDIDRAKRVIGAVASFFLVSSIALACLGAAFSEQILALMQTPPSVRPLAVDYLRIVFLSMPFLYFFTFVMMAQRGAGDARTPFRFMLLAVALDVALNPVFILGLGPAPRMGIAGAAASTLVAQAVTLVAMVWRLYARGSDLRLVGPELRYLKPDPKLLAAIIGKGVPMGLQMAVISLSSIAMMTMVNAYGATTAAAYGVAMQVWTYVQMPAMAIGAAASSMAAQNVGAGLWDRVERTARAGVLLNVALTGILVAILYVVDPYLVDAFLPGQAKAIAIAERINSIAGWSFILFGVTFVLFGIVRATGAVMAPVLILVISLFGVRLAFAHGLEPVLGLDAIWWSFPVSMSVSMALAIAYYRFGGWRRARLAPTDRDRLEDAPKTGVGAPALDADLANAELPAPGARP